MDNGSPDALFASVLHLRGRRPMEIMLLRYHRSKVAAWALLVASIELGAACSSSSSSGNAASGGAAGSTSVGTGGMNDSGGNPGRDAATNGEHDGAAGALVSCPGW